jgi:hypothetical protein
MHRVLKKGRIPLTFDLLKDAASDLLTSRIILNGNYFNYNLLICLFSQSSRRVAGLIHSDPSTIRRFAIVCYADVGLVR